MQDVIKAVRNLGFRYLWIDVLCIIQDSEDDWLAESAKMDDVFRSAVVTLAVAASGDHSEGMFRPRIAHCVRPIRFEGFNLTQDTKERFEKQGSLYLFPATKVVAKGVRPKGVLDTRGWVLQEQLLSPRILYYGSGELYWDCISMSGSESSPSFASLLDDDKSSETWALKYIRRAITGSQNTQVSQKYMGEAWMELIMNYTSRYLTMPLDKLIAIRGIIMAVERRFGRDAILAGLWRSNLWRQLSWWCKHPVVTSQLETRLQAPSWSWLNQDGPVYYQNSLWSKSEFKELISVVDVEHAEASTDLQKSIISGTLTLLGYTFPYTLAADDFKPEAWKRFRRQTRNAGMWWLDEPAALPLKVECVVIGEDNFAKLLICLCITPVARSNKYKRIGLCHWEGMLDDVSRFIGEHPAKKRIILV